MSRTYSLLLAVIFTFLCCLPGYAAQEITPAQQAKIDTLVKEFQGWGTDGKVVAAVKDYNTSPPAASKEMNNEKWTALTVLDPLVRSLAKNELATYLKSKSVEAIGELFVSGADGGKVALFNKTTSWSHKGKAKHDVPMSGKTWQGQAELDESTGKVEVQVAVPVLDGQTAIGSIVVGLMVNKL